MLPLFMPFLSVGHIGGHILHLEIIGSHFLVYSLASVVETGSESCGLNHFVSHLPSHLFFLTSPGDYVGSSDV